jgi:bifunctional non-homologous end joining protein LigD
MPPPKAPRPKLLAKAFPAELPRIIHPQVPVRAERAPTGDRWLHEIKHDGYRMICRIDGDRVTFTSRQQRSWTDRLPSLVEAAGQLKAKQAVLDGELVYLLPDGRSCFDSFEAAIRSRRCARLAYLVFDLLFLDGCHLTSMRLDARKTRLARLVPAVDRSQIRRVEHFDGDGEAFYEQVCKLRLEGVVSKRRDLPYYQAKSRAWLKVKWSGWQSHGENWK